MIWKVLKNRSNEIHSNEIRIRWELPVAAKLNQEYELPFELILACPIF